ncbi:hypothetical protein, partial [Halalkalibacter oceani]
MSAFDLTARLRLVDKFTAPMRKAAKSVEDMEKVQRATQNTLKGVSKQTSKAISTTQRLGQSFSRVTPKFTRMASSIQSGVQNSIIAPFNSAI